MGTAEVETPLLEAIALNDPASTWSGTTSFFGSSFNVMAITVGVGLLSIPAGVASAGWVGILYIVSLGFMATTSGVMLVRSMEAATAKTGRPKRRQYYNGCVTYSCVGHAAMGTFGEVFVMLQVHMTLVGASVIFLILAGSFVQDLLKYLPSEYHLSIQTTTLVCGCIASLHSLFKSLRELGFMSAFNVTVSLYLFGVICLEVWSGSRPHTVKRDSLDKSPWKATAEMAFVLHVLMSFGLVVNAPEASLDKELKKFMLRMSGDDIPGSTDTSVDRSVGKKSSVVSSLDSELSESSYLSLSGNELKSRQSFSWIRHLVVRLGLTAAVTGAAVFFSTKPDAFQNVLGLVSSVTNTFTIFLLPAIFYAALVLPDISSPYQRIGITVWICVLVIVGLACSGIGTYTAIKNLFL